MIYLVHNSIPRLWKRSSHSVRTLATEASAVKDKPEGDISSVFVSLSGGKAPPLPERFAQLKKRLLTGHKEQVQSSWVRLLKKLQEDIEIIKQQSPAIIPEIDFKDIEDVPESFQSELKKRGVAVVRNVVPQEEALKYKRDIQEYIKANPSTKGQILNQNSNSNSAKNPSIPTPRPSSLRTLLVPLPTQSPCPPKPPHYPPLSHARLALCISHCPDLHFPPFNLR
jgi:hypothetical protein